jgi:predicted metalloprotease
MTRRRLRGTALLATATALAVAACTSGGEQSASSPPPATTAPTATTSSSPSPSASSSPSSSPTPTPVKAASCPGGFSSSALRACVASATAVYVAAWTEQLRTQGVAAITAPRTVIFSSPPSNPCVDLSESDVAEASFYCGKNNTVYVSAAGARRWTTQYARVAKERGLLAGDAVTAGTTAARLAQGYPLVGLTTELAHELGHWVQQMAGQRAWYDARSASSDFATSNGATVVAELSADCMAGWVQGRTAADGTWVDTAIGTWAHHATMAELGGDLDLARSGFRFPAERGADIIGYGNAHSRLALYDQGYAAGRADRAGLATCTTAAAHLSGASAPPIA